MQAAVFSSAAPIEKKPLALTNLPMPVPGAGQVRIKIKYCGVCHTDLHIAEGDIHPSLLPIIPGHQVVGIVDEVGIGVDQLEPGERVGIPWLYSACGDCEFCQRGEENLCQEARFTGYNTHGGFAEYMLSEAAYTLPLPAEIDDLTTAPLLCAGIIGYRSLRKADLKPGESLGLVGFGASAHIAIQIANHWNCFSYVFTRSAEHKHHARDLGAVWVGEADQTPPRPLDRVVIFAPAGSLVPLMLEKLRPGGTLAINAIHMSPIPEMSYQKIYGERTLRSVANATHADGVELLQLANTIPIQPTTHQYPLSHVNEALEDIKNSRINGEAVLEISP